VPYKPKKSRKNQSTPDFFSPEELAIKLGCCVDTVRQMRARGEIRAHKIGQRLLYPRSELTRLLKETLS
jgi:excisionase family DNA binding protein